MSAPKLACVILAALCLVPRMPAQAFAIDPVNSKLTVHVSKAGLFSAFGDNHEVAAPIAEGTVDEAGRQVRFVIDAQRMQVLDPHLSPDKRREVQARMLGPEVLDAARFGQIRFESTRVEQTGLGSFAIRGQLSLHGVTRPVTVNVTSENGRYVGTATFKQRDFGITPVSVAGGTVKVKDELKIEFDIRIGAPAAPVTLK